MPKKLYYKYGTVSSAKTMNLLAIADNYERQGKKVILVKPGLDDRFGVQTIKSRLGLERKANLVVYGEDLTPLKTFDYTGVECILVDECQFFPPLVIEYFRYIADFIDIPVMCFGLRTDFKTGLFLGARRLMELADKIEDVKNTCQYCGKRAIFNMKHQGGKLVLDGASVDLGGEEKYTPVCSSCYHKAVMKHKAEQEAQKEREREAISAIYVAPYYDPVLGGIVVQACGLVEEEEDEDKENKEEKEKNTKLDSSGVTLVGGLKAENGTLPQVTFSVPNEEKNKKEDQKVGGIAATGYVAPYYDLTIGGTVEACGLVEVDSEDREDKEEDAQKEKDVQEIMAKGWSRTAAEQLAQQVKTGKGLQREEIPILPVIKTQLEPDDLAPVNLPEHSVRPHAIYFDGGLQNDYSDAVEVSFVVGKNGEKQAVTIPTIASTTTEHSYFKTKW